MADGDDDDGWLVAVAAAFAHISEGNGEDDNDAMVTPPCAIAHGMACGPKNGPYHSG